MIRRELYEFVCILYILLFRMVGVFVLIYNCCCFCVDADLLWHPRCTSFRPLRTSFSVYERTFRNSKPTRRWSHRSRLPDSSALAGNMSVAADLQLWHLSLTGHFWRTMIRPVWATAVTSSGKRLLAMEIWFVASGTTWTYEDLGYVCRTGSDSHSSGREI